MQSRHNLLEICAETYATILQTVVSGRCCMSKCGPISGSCMRLKRLTQLTTGMWCGCKQKRSVCNRPCRQGTQSFNLTLHMIVAACNLVCNYETALKQSGHARASKMVYVGTEPAILIASVSRDHQLHQQTSYAFLQVRAMLPMHTYRNRLRPTAMKWHLIL